MAGKSEAGVAPRYWVAMVGATGESPLALIDEEEHRARLVLLLQDAAAVTEQQRAHFEQDLAPGDRLVAMQASNAVVALLSIASGAAPDDRARAVQCSVKIDHRFEPPFLTVAHLDNFLLLPGDASNAAGWIVKEALEAAQGDGFTVDWNPLVSHF